MDCGHSVHVRLRNRVQGAKRFHWIVIFIWSVLVLVCHPLQIKDADTGKFRLRNRSPKQMDDFMEQSIRSEIPGTVKQAKESRNKGRVLTLDI